MTMPAHMHSKGKIIAYSGTHGTGKTTAVYDRISKLKRDHPELLIGPHVENLVFCPWPINRSATEDSQLWIFTNHIQSELFLMSHYDIVVSDRTAVDAIAYTYELGFTTLADQMLGFVAAHMPNYAEINIMRMDVNDYHYADGLRDEDKPFRQYVESRLLGLYHRLGLYFDGLDDRRAAI